MIKNSGMAPKMEVDNLISMLYYIRNLGEKQNLCVHADIFSLCCMKLRNPHVVENKENQIPPIWCGSYVE
jgi:hypothetical protein